MDWNMKHIARLACLAVVAASLAACATPPPPVDLTPPKKKLDAKTQLETGKTY
jgi:starvation-inducible outer membrane lipoprotein